MGKISRLLAAVLALLMILSFAGCGGDGGSSGSGASTSGSQSSKPGGFGSTSKPSRPESMDAQLMVSDIFKNEVIIYNQTPGEVKTGVLDFSWMNDAPAGKHGYIETKDGDFYFEDGTPVKFWGVNLGFDVAYPDKEVAEAIADELYHMGINMVRIHANTYGGGILDYSDGTTGNFNEENLDKQDYLIYLLKERGIYIYLDLICGREFLVGDGFTQEEYTYFKAGAGGSGGAGCAKTERFFDQRMIDLDKKFVKELLEHVNPYTEMTYAEDPVFAVFQYLNESSIFWQQIIYDSPFNDDIDKLFNDWLVEKYGNREALAAAWTNEKGQCALTADEDPAKGTVKRPSLGVWGETYIDWQAPYVGKGSPARFADFMTCLSEQATGTFLEFYDLIRDCGAKAPITLSNYVMGPVDRKVNTYGDVMERNAYWDKGTAITEVDPQSTFPRNTLINIACASVVDKPLIVTEFNATAANPFKPDAIFQMAAYGALQDWDGLTLFTWTFTGTRSYFTVTDQRDLYTANIDPSVIGEFSVCGAMFRLGIVSEAESTVEVAYTDVDTFTQNSNYLAYNYPFAYVTKFRFNFIGDKYEGDADLVITSGNSATGDYTKANKLFLHSSNPYSDVYQKNNTRDAWLASYIESGAKTKNIGGKDFSVGENTIVSTLPTGSGYLDGGIFVNIFDGVMKEFGIIEEDEGWVDGKVISDTKEIVFDYANDNFVVDTDKVDVFAGKPHGSANGGSFSVTTENDLAAVSIMAVKEDEDKIESATSLFIYAMGRCANNARTAPAGTATADGLGAPPIIYEDIRGTLSLTSEQENIKVWGLNHTGERKKEMAVEKTATGFDITIGGYCYYEVEVVA